MYPERVKLSKAIRWLTAALRPASEPSDEKGSVAFDTWRAKFETTAQRQLLDAFREGRITPTGRFAVPYTIDKIPARIWSAEPPPSVPISATAWPENTDHDDLDWLDSRLTTSDGVFLYITVSFEELRTLGPGGIAKCSGTPTLRRSRSPRGIE